MSKNNRVFYNGELKEIIELDDETARKIKTVLRLNINDKLTILTHEKLAIGEVSLISKNKVFVRIIQSRDIKKPTYKLTVFQCIAKRDYMDNIIEKYAEIGATQIVPVISTYSQNNIIKSNTMQRYKAIAINAGLQSEAEFITEIAEPIDIRTIQSNAIHKLLFHERVGEKKLPDNLDNDVSMIIGAEGGFTEIEYNMLINKGFVAYHPIDKILKAETAATVFSSIIMMKMKNV